MGPRKADTRVTAPAATRRTEPLQAEWQRLTPVQLLTAMIELADIRSRRELAAARFGEPKRAKLLGLYDQLEANQLEHGDKG